MLINVTNDDRIIRPFFGRPQIDQIVLNVRILGHIGGYILYRNHPRKILLFICYSMYGNSMVIKRRLNPLFFSGIQPLWRGVGVFKLLASRNTASQIIINYLHSGQLWKHGNGLYCPPTWGACWLTNKRGSVKIGLYRGRRVCFPRWHLLPSKTCLWKDLSLSTRDLKSSQLNLLKGQCHAIWQLYKKLEGVFASVEFQK